tara:strand:+ start:5664 stop:6974 length:1311 start_codon:yes stop_codon:yes gene_type:complete
MDYKNQLINLIDKKKAKIGIVGLGYVGLPLALSFLDNGFDVIGFDIDKSKIRQINLGESYIKHIPSNKIRKSIKSKKFIPTLDFSLISEVDVIIICVPTPLTKYRDPDLSFILSTMASIKPFLKKGQIISLESTTYPGTTKDVILPSLEKIGFLVGENLFLVYSPEREDPGNIKYHTSNIPKVIGGTTSACLKVGRKVYGSVVNEVINVSSTKVAEMTKLLENIHRAVNIGLMNELKVLCDQMDIDLYEVIEAASTKPFGFVPYYPGPGLGGHCIPIDPFYLTWKAKEYEMHTRFIELAGEINSGMPKYVISKTADLLNDHGKSISKSKILIIGLAYKKNVDDTRESPALKIIQLLIKKGAEVEYSDPLVNKMPKTRKYNFNLRSIELLPENIKKFDVTIIVTDHDSINYKELHDNSKLIIDTRGRYKKCKNVWRA